MATLLLPFDDQPDGTIATAALAGFSTIQLGSGGGVSRYSDAYSFSGRGGLLFTTGTSICYGRVIAPSQTTSIRGSFGVTLPDLTPTTSAPILDFWLNTGSEVRGFAFVWTTTRQLVLRGANLGTTTGQVILFAADALAAAQRIRIEIVDFTIAATASFTIKVYDRNTDTLLAAAFVGTIALTNVGPLAYVNVGAASTGFAAGTKIGIDNVRLSDTAGSELGAYWPPAASPAYPERLSTNGGNYPIVGGATSIPAALRDASDSTYIEAPGAVANEAFSVRLAALPAGTKSWTVRASNGGTMRVEIMQDTTVIATRNFTIASGTAWADYVTTLTTSEDSAVTDQNALVMRVTTGTA